MSDNNLDTGALKYVSFDIMIELWAKNCVNWMPGPHSTCKNCV